MLHVEVAGHGPRLVLAHGFTQTARSWGAFAEAMARGRQIVAVDLPGHGGSSEVRANVVESGDLLLEAAGDEPYDLLGYSMGARVALHAALAGSPALRRLVLIGGTAGIEEPEARAARRRRDEATAAELERTGDVDGFLTRWVAMPMFAGLREPGLDERRRNTAAGLAASLRLAGTGTQAPLWDRLATMHVPLLCLAGADDLRFIAAGRRMARAAVDGVFSVVPGAGHAAHLAQPRLCAVLVDHFIG